MENRVNRIAYSYETNSANPLFHSTSTPKSIDLIYYSIQNIKNIQKDNGMLRQISIIMALVAINAQANSIYKCQDGDNVIFSQTPCATEHIDNQELNHSNIQNAIAAEPNTKNINPDRYILSQQKERVISKMESLKRQFNTDVEIIKNKTATAGENRAGSSLLKVLQVEFNETRNTYQKKMAKEINVLKKVEQKIRELDNV